jgi:tRNA (guanine-N7-)-methyltransferase
MNELNPGINLRADGERPIDPRGLFGNDHRVILEIGSGKGRFLVQSAAANPGTNFIGVERSLHYYRVIEAKIRKQALTNAVIVNYDAGLLVEKLLPPESIDEIHIYFPDPWPRPRERKRRLIREEVLQGFVRVMKRDAIGYYVTDHREYFEKAAVEIERVFDAKIERDVKVEPRTNYEEKYQIEGRPIYQATFRRK